MTNLNLFRRALMLSLIAGALVFAFAVPSFAGGANNSDVLDIDDDFDATSGSALETNNVEFRTGQSANSYYYGGGENSATRGTYLKGSVFNSDVESGNSIRLLWFAFEPDTVKRTDAGASIRQKSNIALGVYLYGSTSVNDSGLVEGCSAKGKIKVGATTTKASASLKCPKSVWEDLGFTEMQIERIKDALKSPKVKFGFKGDNNLSS